MRFYWPVMTDVAEITPRVTVCNCQAVRQAARHVTQLYDRHMAPVGLRITQYSLMMTLSRLGPLSINALADHMVMDRTTMGRALRPLQRDGLIAIGRGKDGRTRALSLTPAGKLKLDAAMPLWRAAQAEFEAAFGTDESADFRATLAKAAVLFRQVESPVP